MILRRRFAVFAFTTLLLLVALALGDAHLSVIDGEFVSLHIGYPGQDVSLRLRWDLDYIALFPTVDFSQISRTFAEADHYSDDFCFGARCVRLPFVYVGSEPPHAHPEAAAELVLTGHQGVLGLGPGSPLRAIYPWFRYNGDELELHSTAPHRTHDAIAPLSDGYFPARVAGAHYWLALDLARDYTLAPWELGTAKRAWRLELFRQHGSALDRALSVRVHPGAEHTHTPDNAAVPMVRAAPLVEVAAAAGWNASAAITLGRLMTQELFTLVLGPSGAVAWAEPLCAHRPRIRRLDYIPFVLVLLMLLVLWQLGINEDVSVARQTAEVDIGPPPATGVALPVGGEPLLIPPGVLVQPELPDEVGHPWQANSLLAFRHEGAALALGLLTALTATCLFLSVTMGFGLGWAFHHTERRAQDMAATYSSAGMLVLLAAGAVALHRQPTTSALYGVCVPLVGLWLVAMLEACSVVTTVLLLLTSGVVCVYALYLWLGALLGTHWPGAVYGNILPSRHYLRGAILQPLQPLYAFWLMLNSVFAAWAVWLFGFYTVPFVVTAWRPAHPTAYGIGVLAVLMALVGATSLYHSQQMLVQKLAALGAERTRKKAAEADAAVSAKEAARKKKKRV